MRTLSGGVSVLASAMLAVAVIGLSPMQSDPSVTPAGKGQVQANGVSLAYETFGSDDREAVLLIMGASSQLTMWHLELCEELVKRGYRVIRFDNRDVGLSTRFDAAGMPDFAAVVAAAQAGTPAPLDYTIDDMAADAVGLLDALRIGKAHIAGVSMGAMIGQSLAADYPDRVLSLTSMMASSGKPGLPLFARPDILAKIPPPAAEGDKKGYIEYRMKVLETIGSQHTPIPEDELRKWVVRDVERAFYPLGEARHAAASLFAASQDRRAKLKTIKVPTIVVQGEDDPLVPEEAARDVATNIAGAEYRLVPGLGHVLPPAMTNEIADAISAAASRATKP